MDPDQFFYEVEDLLAARRRVEDERKETERVARRDDEGKVTL